MKLIVLLIGFALVVCDVSAMNITTWGDISVDFWGERQIFVEPSPNEVKNHTFKFPMPETVSKRNTK